jgi:hypothetical protein
VSDNCAYPREHEYTSITTLADDGSDDDAGVSSTNTGPSLSEEVMSASSTLASNRISAADGEATTTSTTTSAAVGATASSSAAVGATTTSNGQDNGQSAADADEEWLYLYMGRCASFALYYKVGCAENDELLERRKKVMAQYFSADLVFEAFPISMQRLQAIGINALVTLEALAFSLIDQYAMMTYGHTLRLSVRSDLKYIRMLLYKPS